MVKFFLRNGCLLHVASAIKCSYIFLNLPAIAKVGELPYSCSQPHSDERESIPDFDSCIKTGPPPAAMEEEDEGE